MKRLWLGVGVLGLLLATGFGVMALADTRQEDICRSLEQAKQAALAEDWPQVQQLMAAAKGKWEESWGMWTALADHTELDEIDAGFARLEVYGRDGHATDFAAESASLARQVKALGEGHRLSLTNLF